MTLIFELVLDSYEQVPAIWNEVYDPYKFHKKIHINKRIIHSYFQANRKEMDNQLAILYSIVSRQIRLFAFYYHIMELLRYHFCELVYKSTLPACV